VNHYQRVWDGGYGKRWARIMATSAPIHRKQGALQRLWARMTA